MDAETHFQVKFAGALPCSHIFSVGMTFVHVFNVALAEKYFDQKYPILRFHDRFGNSESMPRTRAVMRPVICKTDSRLQYEYRKAQNSLSHEQLAVGLTGDTCRDCSTGSKCCDNTEMPSPPDVSWPS